MINIEELIKETECTEFLVDETRRRTDQHDDETDENLLEVECFLRESNKRLSVIEEETRRVTLEGATVLGYGDTGTCKGHSGDVALESFNDGETKDAFNTLKQAWKDLMNLESQIPPSKAKGGCRPRTSSRSQLTRPRSSFPILERSVEGPSVSENDSKVKFDINILELELSKLISTSESLDTQPALADTEPSSLYQVPATPPSTPAISIHNAPILPSEIYRRNQTLQTQNANFVPPPKPPRLFLHDGDETKNTGDPTVGEKSNFKAGHPPPKPPRLNSSRAQMDKLRIRIAKMSRSLGNLSVLDESEESDKTMEPFSADDISVDGRDATKNTSRKVENFFSKFTTKRKTKRSQSVSIGSPTQFKHVAGSTKLREEIEKKEICSVENKSQTEIKISEQSMQMVISDAQHRDKNILENSQLTTEKDVTATDTCSSGKNITSSKIQISSDPRDNIPIVKEVTNISDDSIQEQKKDNN